MKLSPKAGQCVLCLLMSCACSASPPENACEAAHGGACKTEGSFMLQQAVQKKRYSSSGAEEAEEAVVPFTDKDKAVWKGLDAMGLIFDPRLDQGHGDTYFFDANNQPDYVHNPELKKYANLMLAYARAVYKFENGASDHDNQTEKIDGPESEWDELKGQTPYDFCTPIQNADTFRLRSNPELSFSKKTKYHDTQSAIYEWERDQDQILTLAMRGSEMNIIMPPFFKELREKTYLENLLKAKNNLVETARDWFFTDFQIERMKDEICPGGDDYDGKLHEGFQGSWLTLRSLVLSKLNETLQQMKKKASHKPVKVFVTGHSLGAALAQLATYDLWCNPHWLNGHKLYGTITFGTAPTFAGRASLERYMEKVPKENRFRVEACSKLRDGSLPGRFMWHKLNTQGSAEDDGPICTECEETSCEKKDCHEGDKCHDPCDGSGIQWSCKLSRANCWRKYHSCTASAAVQYASCVADSKTAYVACKVKKTVCDQTKGRYFGADVATCDIVGADEPSDGILNADDGTFQAAWVRQDGENGIFPNDEHCYGMPHAGMCHKLERYAQGLRRSNDFNGDICAAVADPDDTKRLTPEKFGGGQIGFPHLPTPNPTPAPTPPPTPPPPCDYNIQYQSGHAFHVRHGSSGPMQCRSLCSNDGRCHFWDFEPSGSGWCRLRSDGGPRGAMTYSGFTGGPKNCKVPFTCYWGNYAYHSGHMINHKAPGVVSPAECQARCLGTSNCNFWDWEMGHRICRLRSGQGHGLHWSPGWDAGPKRCFY